MNKTEITTIVANKLANKVNKKEVASVINTFLDTLQEALTNNEKISFKSFLTFETRFVKAKSGNSFSKEWSVPARYVPKVKFSSSFKKKIATEVKDV